MNLSFVKILFISVVVFFFTGCNSVKKVKDSEYLLTKNNIHINGELSKDKSLYSFLIQKPNRKLLGSPVKLNIFNMARENADSVYIAKLKSHPGKKKSMRRFLSKKQVNRYAGRKYTFNEWIKKIGESPTIINKKKTEKSQKRLESYFWNRGWFNVSTDYEVVATDSLKAEVNYYITTKKPYKINSLKETIASKDADSIYKSLKNKSRVKVGKQYNTLNLESERNRITKAFRNNGLFYFERDYIKFDADTINANNNVDLRLKITNRKVNGSDSTSIEPFKVQRISKVKIFTDSNFKNSRKTPADTAYYRGYELYSYDKLRFKPKAIANAVFLSPNTVYSDSLRSLTYNSINNLRVFKYPTISFEKDKQSSSNESLVANILLTPRKKYAIGLNFDVSTSTIQDIGVGLAGSLTIRNVFRRAETLEISARTSLGSSQDVAENDNRFFNIVEFGGDARLNFPRILAPFNTDRVIKKSSSPQTTLKVGLNTQQNIGLDKENVTGAIEYRWKPNQKISHRFNLFNLQFVRNLNTNNYFNVYSNSYRRIYAISKKVLSSDSNFYNDNGDLIISGGVNGFLNSALEKNIDGISINDFNTLRNLRERQERLSEDNLILSTSYNFILDTRSNLYDKSFTRWRFKIENAGNMLSNIATIGNIKKNNEDNFDLFGVEFSQFVKFETELVKHWRLNRKNVFATRLFAGVAFPYGNSNSIPFSQSYFAGGSNDNRGWLAYGLGPGSSNGINEFNEANFKLAFNAEYRFNIIGSFEGALFTDVGNIWNVLDSFKDEEDVSFSKLSDLDELAVATGLGIRYDFSFFVLRLDAALKMYNPGLAPKDRWLSNTRLDKAVYNVGINYPF